VTMPCDATIFVFHLAAKAVHSCPTYIHRAGAAG
jgi:hypothetical protein